MPAVFTVELNMRTFFVLILLIYSCHAFSDSESKGGSISSDLHTSGGVIIGSYVENRHVISDPIKDYLYSYYYKINDENSGGDYIVEIEVDINGDGSDDKLISIYKISAHISNFNNYSIYLKNPSTENYIFIGGGVKMAFSRLYVGYLSRIGSYGFASLIYNPEKKVNELFVYRVGKSEKHEGMYGVDRIMMLYRAVFSDGELDKKIEGVPLLDGGLISEKFRVGVNSISEYME